MITLTGEFLEQAKATRGNHRVAFFSWDEGDVYTLVHSRNSPGTVPGTVYVNDRINNVDVSRIGYPDDQVRILAEARLNSDNSGKDNKSGNGKNTQIQGYVRQAGNWDSSPVQVIPIREELFSRNRGILESNVISDKTVLLLGLGSIGSEIAVRFTTLGILQMILMDHDRFELSNNIRHIAGLSHLGRFKVNPVKDLIHEKNPFVQVETHPVKADWDHVDLVRECVRKSDLVICSTDNRESKLLINQICVEENKTLIFAGAFRRAYGGMVLVVHPKVSLCYQCYVTNYLNSNQPLKQMDQEKPIAYSNRPVPVEPGLGIDISPISLMAVKVGLQELLKGRPTTLQSLDEDLIASLYIWINRREPGTDYENIEELAYNLNGFHIVRWYGISVERDPACPICGDFTLSQLQNKKNKITPKDLAEFARE